MELLEIELSRTSDTRKNTSFRRLTHMITSLFAFRSDYNDKDDIDK